MVDLAALVARLDYACDVEFSRNSTDAELFEDSREILKLLYAKQQMDSVVHPDADKKLTELIKLYDEAPADAVFSGNHPILMLCQERDTWMKRLNKVIDLVKKQAEDESLWFKSQYASEAYLQDALRKLHALIEAK